ncbi:FtsX-like permease family protein [Streptomyces sp. NPDC091279]|uniref:FtsX-like permease family protein n=1 Tax=Streptomyces sp. NPDC091279 TaxID=3365983 RepID=UPI0037F48E11
MRTELRLARQLTRGAGRREGARFALMALGAALATGFALVAVALASLRSGQFRVSVGNGLLDTPGVRDGVIVALLLLLVPVLGFLGQCTRIGAVQRERRFAGLRLAGATPGQVRGIAALETGLACLVGGAVTTVVAVLVLVRAWSAPNAFTWAGVALVAVAVPVLGALAGAGAMHRVVASPLGLVRRVRPGGGRRAGLVCAAGVLLVAVVPLAGAVTTARGSAALPLLVFGPVLAVGAGAVGLSGAVAGLVGRRLAVRARTAATLIAAERLRDDPWAAARSHAAVLLVTVAGAGFVGIRGTLVATLDAMGWHTAEERSFYVTGLDVTAFAIVVALGVTLAGLAVGTAESVANRRRGLAAQHAAGVERAVLGRALLLETALPLAPALLLAGVGGTAVGVWYDLLAGPAGTTATPYPGLLVPLGVYALCLAAAATALPRLRRSVRPTELRYA